jgi:hypothetical protein
LSYPLWLIDTPLRIVQFPHRFIYVASATGLVSNLLSLRDLQRMRQARWQKLVVALPLILGFAATGVLSAKLSFIDGKPHHLYVDATIPYLGLPEYRLRTQGKRWETFYRAGGFAVECLEKELTCDTIQTSSSYRQAVSGAHPISLRLPLFAFQHGMTIDGMPVERFRQRPGSYPSTCPSELIYRGIMDAARRRQVGLASLLLRHNAPLFAFRRRSPILTR